MANTRRNSRESGRQRRPSQHQLILNFDRLLRDNKGGTIDNPIRYIPDDQLREYLEPLRINCEDAVSMDDLERGAKLAKMEHALDLGVETRLLTTSERKSLDIQRSAAFWREPKDLQMTLAVCCIAAAVQGWGQVANGNPQWPKDLHKVLHPYERNTENTMIFAAVQAIPWFSAAILGSYLSDPLSEYLGRRKALFVSGLCSFIASVAGSQGHYSKAYTTLLRLRKENVLAAKEMVSIHYQIQAERAVFLRRQADPENTGLDPFQRRLGRSNYWERLYNMVWFPRIRRAAVAAMVVMLAQQLSGINIYAFMATQFYISFSPVETSSPRDKEPSEDQIAKSFTFAIVFGLANMIFSIVAFFLVENKGSGSDAPERQADHNTSDLNDSTRRRQQDTPDPSTPDRISSSSGPSPCNRTSRHSRSSSVSTFNSADYGHQDRYRLDTRIQFRGRRFLLLTSLAAGVVTLLLTATMFSISEEHNNAREPMIILFTIVFAAFYSPGAGAIPFLYCAEIFPNEGRELGMSWSTFWNFLGAGILAMTVPFGIEHQGRLLGAFSGFNAIAFILVWFLVPGTNHTATLEDMSYVFGRRMRDHVSTQAKRLLPGTKVRGPNLQWPTVRREGGEDGQVQPPGNTPHES
ncbi:MAG: hypothetical protein Q9209_002430 [Squamulea sp. 1 TL-2023]